VKVLKKAVISAGLCLAMVATGSGLVASGSPKSRDADRGTAHVHAAAQSEPAMTKAHLRNKMRKLWEDHIVWTRMFIVSSIADLPDAGTAAGRLLLNQEHIGNAIKPYYGTKAGNALTALLKDHILIAADLLTAAKQGDEAGVADASERWDDNAVAIARFLSKANPDNWPRSEMVSMMRHHLELTLNEAVARLNADWDADVATYDKIHRQIIHMADMLSSGIIRQFPGRF
jgi:hypothetical protein